MVLKKRKVPDLGTLRSQNQGSLKVIDLSGSGLDPDSELRPVGMTYSHKVLSVHSAQRCSQAHLELLCFTYTYFVHCCTIALLCMGFRTCPGHCSLDYILSSHDLLTSWCTVHMYPTVEAKTIHQSHIFKFSFFSYHLPQTFAYLTVNMYLCNTFRRDKLI
jgi:hypothetical protein